MNKNQIFSLIGKELLSEWRQRFALNGMVLYLASTIFVCYMSFGLKVGAIDAVTWNALFWIILLFTAVNSVAKSFIQESRGRALYYYSIASPIEIIISKTIYNALLLLALALVGFVIYSFVMERTNEDGTTFDLLYFLIAIVLGSLGLASSLTMISGIAAKAENSTSLMAVLSFPVILPIILMVIKLSKNAMDGLDRSVSTDEILILVAINAIVFAVSYLLFPYLWRS
ncbi:heme exporter protein B [Roseivirga ehrenbergii]|uniref:heme exporter protein CcmB n=1 Tax=Roseivirga ehrenbergii (strain DSM 102268 / JCM 13514 / KCTC 12282 / NCIMB 14502 / KMM 6017) TaxID=279360 RepID=UPI000AF1D0D8|nr:ABC transporter permease [Roseivirga ehrenbergii]TCL00206.1 heme exporter protein B [Roseivirga ehrenbergii]